VVQPSHYPHVYNTIFMNVCLTGLDTICHKLAKGFGNTFVSHGAHDSTRPPPPTFLHCKICNWNGKAGRPRLNVCKKSVRIFPGAFPLPSYPSIIMYIILGCMWRVYTRYKYNEFINQCIYNMCKKYLTSIIYFAWHSLL
jgi:hypothetical protein